VREGAGPGPAPPQQRRQSLTVNATGAATAGLFVTLAVTLAACGGSEATATSQESPAPLGAGRQELEPGTHVLDLVARDESGTGPASLPRIEMTVPEGWFNFDGWGLGRGNELPFPIAVSFWDVDKVYPTPCDWAAKPMIDPGPDTDGLAATLAKQPLRSATAPADIVLAGFRGKYLELSVPTDIDFDEARKDQALFPPCDEATFQSWTASGWASDRYQQRPGQVDQIWILDVDGERLVIDAWYLAEATPEDRAELERVVESIRFLE
jgi:hypothetical protein